MNKGWPVSYNKYTCKYISLWHIGPCIYESKHHLD